MKTVQLNYSNFVPTGLSLDDFIFSTPETESLQTSPPATSSPPTMPASPSATPKFCFLPKPHESPTPLFTDLKPGNIVQLEPDRTRDVAEFFGCLSRPVVVVKTHGARFVAVIPLSYRPRQSSLFPPLLINGSPAYAVLTGTRVIRISRLLGVKRVGTLSKHAFSTLSAEFLKFLAPPEL